MKNSIIYKAFFFVGLVVMQSCGGGSGGGSDPDPIIVTPNPLSAATLVFPNNNETCEEGTSINSTESDVNFRWNTAANTDTYDLRVTNINTSQIQTFAALTSTSKIVRLVKGDPYSWSVVCKSSKSTQTATSSTWQFYMAGEGISNYAPFAATLNSPNSGATVTPTDNKVTLSWEGSDPDTNDTLTYTVYIDKVDGEQTPIDILKDLSVQTIDVDVEPDTVYYWRIKTSDGQNSSFSIVYTFKTE